METTAKYPETSMESNLAAMDEIPPSVFNTFVIPTLFVLVFVTGSIGNSLVIYVMKTLVS